MGNGQNQDCYIFSRRSLLTSYPITVTYSNLHFSPLPGGRTSQTIPTMTDLVKQIHGWLAVTNQSVPSSSFFTPVPCIKADSG